LIEDYEKIMVDYQRYYTQLMEAIKFSDMKLKQIDRKGSFSSDDEIGYFFKMVQDLQILLNSFDHTSKLPPDELPKQPAKPLK
jgi:hypothetical protein